MHIEPPLLHGYVITYIAPCLIDPARWRATARLFDDVSPVLPYLNAVLPGAIYAPSGPTLTLNMGGKLVTVFARKVAIAQAPSQDDVFRTTAWVQEIVNETWIRREALVPSFERRKPRQPLQVWELLPRSNCKACGEATCMAFAFGLLQGRRRLDECAPLDDEGWTEQRTVLERWLASV